MYQQLIIVGNLGRDPEMRYTPQGIALCDFSVAVNKNSGKGENRSQETTWFKVTCWRDTAEIAAKLLHKGDRAMLIGEISVSAYMDKNGGGPRASLDMTARQLVVLQPKEAPETADIPF